MIGFLINFPLRTPQTNVLDIFFFFSVTTSVQTSLRSALRRPLPFINPLSFFTRVREKPARSPGPSIFRTGELNLAIRYWGTDGMVGRDRRTNRQTGTHRTAGARRRILARPKGEPVFHFLSRRFYVCSSLQQNDSSSMRL